MRDKFPKFYPGYTGSFPQEPYKPESPKKDDFIGHGSSKGKCIYSDSEIVNEDYAERLEELDDEDKPPKGKGGKSLRDNLTLQDILNLAPSGADPKDIVLNLSYPRYVEYITVSFNHIKRDLEAEEKAYQRALNKHQQELAKYQKEYAQFLKDSEAYKNWIKEQEIKELEEKLAKLKK
jgi:hypothetical protein